MARRRVPSLAALAVAGATAVALLPMATAFAAAPDASTPAASSAVSHVIVLLKNQHPSLPADPASVAARVKATTADQAPLLRDIKAHAGHAGRSLHVVNALAATVSAAEQSRLAADPAVAAVVPDRLVAAPRRTQPAESGAAATGSTRSTTSTRSTGARAADTAAPPGVCPSNPAHPQLEPQALQQTSTAFDDPSTPSAQHLATGRGVKVAFLADGIDIDNPDFIRPDGSHVFTDYKDFSGDGPDAPTSGAEAFGDASSIAAQGRETYDLSTFVNPAHPLPVGCTIRVLGVSPGAQLIGLKIFPAGGFAFNSAILAALDYAVTIDHADVVNESFGSNQYPDTNDDPTAVFNAELAAAVVTVVASSGDAGPESTIGSPASTPGVIAVGATTSFRSYAQTGYYGFPLSNGTFASSNISALSSSGVTQPGGTIDLVAPGDLNWALCSTKPDIYQDCADYNGNPSPIQLFGGTSEAAPLTAGAAALVIQAYRDSHHGATPSGTLVEQILTSSADDLGLPGAEQGAGQLDSLRAVRLARSLRGSTVAGAGGLLISAATQLDLTAKSGRSTHGKIRVLNTGSTARTITPRLRAQTTVLSDNKSSVVLSPTTDPVTLSQVGGARSYRETPFTVPSGASRLAASIAWPNAATVVRLVLLDPSGTLEAYSLPQGLGNFATVDVRSPKAGKWTAAVITTAGAAGYAGPVQLETTSFATSFVGRVSPRRLTLAPGRKANLTVTTPGGPAADSDYALQLDTSGSPAPVVPVVVRSLISTGAAGGSFSGSFSGGNGRAGIPNPSVTYAFDVPPGRADLDLGFTVTGDPGQAIYGFLVDPNGEPVSERTNQSTDAAGAITLGRSLQFFHAAPQAGRWQLVLAVFGPIAGTSVSTGYTGQVGYGGVKVTTAGVPVGAVLPAGKPVSASITVHNTGVSAGQFFADARLPGRVNLPLIGTNADGYKLAPAPLAPFPAFGVPTETDALTVTSTADHPISFEVSPFPADHTTDLSFEGDPDRIASPVGLSPAVTVADPIVAPQTWLALPSSIGPFATTAPTTTVSFTASAHTRAFDPAVSSSTGDPLLTTISSTAPVTTPPVTTPPATTPLAVASGAAGTITVTITPTGARGSVVRGILYVDSRDAVTGSTDELIGVPYSYTIG